MKHVFFLLVSIITMSPWWYIQIYGKQVITKVECRIQIQTTLSVTYPWDTHFTFGTSLHRPQVSRISTFHHRCRSPLYSDPICWCVWVCVDNAKHIVPAYFHHTERSYIEQYRKNLEMFVDWRVPGSEPLQRMGDLERRWSRSSKREFTSRACLS